MSSASCQQSIYLSQARVSILFLVLQMSCASCQQSIEGNGVNALGKAYHPGCFLCVGCGGQFEKDFAVGENEQPFHSSCLPDHDDPISSSTPCQNCRLPIGEGHILRSGGQVFHKECITCHVCSKSISGNMETLGNGNFVHELCLPVSSCFICRQSIDGALVVLPNGSEACSECFVCFKCGESFSTLFTEEEGRYYHERCIESKETLCDECKKPLTDPAVNVENRVMHSNCFVCSKCNMPFSDSYIKVDGKYLHKECDK